MFIYVQLPFQVWNEANKLKQSVGIDPEYANVRIFVWRVEKHGTLTIKKSPFQYMIHMITSISFPSSLAYIHIYFPRRDALIKRCSNFKPTQSSPAKAAGTPTPYLRSFFRGRQLARKNPSEPHHFKVSRLYLYLSISVFFWNCFFNLQTSSNGSWFHHSNRCFNHRKASACRSPGNAPSAWQLGSSRQSKSSHPVPPGSQAVPAFRIPKEVLEFWCL